MIPEPELSRWGALARIEANTVGGHRIEWDRGLAGHCVDCEAFVVICPALAGRTYMPYKGTALEHQCRKDH